jgi:nitrous oxidase accessory protein
MTRSDAIFVLPAGGPHTGTLGRRPAAWLAKVAYLAGLALLVLTGLSAAGAEEAGQPAGISADQLAAAIDQAQPGATIVVNGGTYHGHLVLDKPLTLIGQNWPTIDGGGTGTVLTLRGAGTTISGFVIRDSGHSLDQENTGVAGEASDLTIRGNRFVDTLFGIYLRQANGSVVADNVITSKDLDVPRRGDPIRVWSSSDVLIENNEVYRGRDVVLWYSERMTLRGNTVRDGRYGFHFMYCDDALMEGNRLLDNSVGTFMMYSRRLVMRNNTVAGNRGPSGYGIGLKDLDDVAITNNLFLDNRIGAYIDGSPREVDSTGLFAGNVFAYNDIGVQLLPAVRNNEFYSNSFIENEEQVAISAGGGRATANAWSVNGQGNYWSDYAGFDAAGDGLGDLPYHSQRLFENLMQQEPALRLFLYSPASNALDFAARAFPMIKPQAKLTDDFPLMVPQIPAQTPPLPAEPTGLWPWLTIGLVGLSLALIALPRLSGRRGYVLMPAGQPATVSEMPR